MGPITSRDLPPGGRGQNPGTSPLLESKPFHISIPLSQEARKRPGQELLTMSQEGMVERREGMCPPAQGSTGTPHLLQLQ